MDALHDTSWRQWLDIAQTYKVPGYVLKHSPLEKEAAANMVDELFADPVNKQFPISSPADTWLSAAYFHENRGNFDPDLAGVIEDTIKVAASLYDIASDVKTVLAYKKAEIIPEDLPENYGFIDKKGGKHYPMFDVEGVVKAAEHFDRYRNIYGPDLRRTIALGIVKKSHEYNVAIQPSVFKEAGIGIPNKVDILDNILDRAQMTKDANAQVAIANVASLVYNASPEELMSNLDKIASIITDLDVLNGMDSEYGKKLLAPADFLYSMAPKEAAAFMKQALTLDKHTFNIDKLASISPSIFREALGDDMFKAITDAGGKLDVVKMAEVLPTLPRPDKIALEEHIVFCCAE